MAGNAKKKDNLNDLIEEAITKEGVVDTEPFVGLGLDNVSLDEQIAGSQFAKEINNKINKLAEIVSQVNSQNERLIGILSNPQEQNQPAQPAMLPEETAQQQILKHPAGSEPSFLDKLLAIMRETKECLQSLAYIAQKSEPAKAQTTAPELEAIEAAYKQGKTWINIIDSLKEEVKEDAKKEIKTEMLIDTKLAKITEILKELELKKDQENQVESTELPEMKSSELIRNITTGSIEHLS